jgi:hypothetical protein
MGKEESKPNRFRISLKAWAGWVALALVLLVRLGVITKVPW